MLESKIVTFDNFKGMQQDNSVVAINQDARAVEKFVYENKNIRILADKTNSQTSITTEVGPKYLFQLKGYPVGDCVANNNWVIFTSRVEGSEDDESVVSRIYVLNIENLDSYNDMNPPEPLWEDEPGTSTYQLSLDPNIKLETKFFFENEDVQKVYWVDGVNQCRFINIVASSKERQRWKTRPNPFDFLPKLDLEEEVTITKLLDSTGYFKPGVLQYFLTYVNLYGQESNIFYASPLYYTSHQDRGGMSTVNTDGTSNELCNNAFQITVRNTQTCYDYIRIYSIHRTAIDEVPYTKQVVDLRIPESGEVTYKDINIDGIEIASTDLFFKQRSPFSAKTLEDKDNTLFLGGISTAQFEQINGSDILDITEWITDVFDDSAHETYFSVDFTEDSFLELPENSQYPYESQLHLNSYQIKHFKRGNTYRFGIQLQDEYGRWSKVIYLNDKVNTSEVETSFKPVNLQDSEWKYLDIVGEDISSEGEPEHIVYGVKFKKPSISDANASSFQKTKLLGALNILKKGGFKKIRPVIVYPRLQESETIAQGIVAPTVFGLQNRANGAPHAQSSWFFRPNPGFNVSTKSEVPQEDAVDLRWEGNFEIHIDMDEQVDLDYKYIESDNVLGEYEEITDSGTIKWSKNKMFGVNDTIFMTALITDGSSEIQLDDQAISVVSSEIETTKTKYGPSSNLYKVVSIILHCTIEDIDRVETLDSMFPEKGYQQQLIKTTLTSPHAPTSMPYGVFEKGLCDVNGNYVNRTYGGFYLDATSSLEVTKTYFQRPDPITIFGIWDQTKKLSFSKQNNSNRPEFGAFLQYKHFNSIPGVAGHFSLDLSSYTLVDPDCSYKSAALESSLQRISRTHSSQKAMAEFGCLSQTPMSLSELWTIPFRNFVDKEAITTYETYNQLCQSCYFIDQSIVTFHTPDMEYNTALSTLPANIKFRIVGFSPITSHSANKDILTDQPQTTPFTKNEFTNYADSASGFTKALPDTQLSVFSGRVLNNGAFWQDEISYRKGGNKNKVPTRFVVYPWNKTGSITNSVNRVSWPGKNDDENAKYALKYPSITGKLKTNLTANTRISYTNYYFDSPEKYWFPNLTEESTENSYIECKPFNNTLDLLQLEDNDGTRSQVLNYYGNVNTVIRPNANIRSENGIFSTLPPSIGSSSVGASTVQPLLFYTGYPIMISYLGRSDVEHNQYRVYSSLDPDGYMSLLWLLCTAEGNYKSEQDYPIYALKKAVGLNYSYNTTTDYELTKALYNSEMIEDGTSVDSAVNTSGVSLKYKSSKHIVLNLSNNLEKITPLPIMGLSAVYEADLDEINKFLEDYNISKPDPDPDQQSEEPPRWISEYGIQREVTETPETFTYNGSTTFTALFDKTHSSPIPGEREEYQLDYWFTSTTPIIVLGDKLINPYSYLWIGELYRDIDPNTIYGGKSSNALSKHFWLPCGDGVLIDKILDSSENGTTMDLTKVKWEEGDTYYQRYDCMKTYPQTTSDENQVYETLSFMCETRYNIDGRYDQNRQNSDSFTCIPGVNFNLFNEVYSQDNNFFSFEYLDRSKINTKTFSNFVTWSLPKVPGEETDNWATTTLANTLEFDGDKGKITELTRYNNQLICLQEKGVSIIKYNENVQIPTENGLPIQLGNSQRVDGKEYLSTITGCQNKYAVVTTDSGVLFTDDNHKTVYGMGIAGSSQKAVENIPVAVNMASFFKNNKINYFLYDQYFQEIYMNFSNDLIISFNLLSGMFTSLYSYGPLLGLQSILGIPLSYSATTKYNQKYTNIYKMFNGNPCYFFDQYEDYYTILVANPAPYTAKIFNTVEFNGYSVDRFNQEIDESPYNTLEVWNEYQRGVQQLSTSSRISTLKKKFRTWRANVPRDQQSEAAARARIRSPWAYIKLSREVKGSTDRLHKSYIHNINVQYLG